MRQENEASYCGFRKGVKLLKRDNFFGIVKATIMEILEGQCRRIPLIRYDSAGKWQPQTVMLRRESIVDCRLFPMTFNIHTKYRTR